MRSSLSIHREVVQPLVSLFDELSVVHMTAAPTRAAAPPAASALRLCLIPSHGRSVRDPLGGRHPLHLRPAKQAPAPQTLSWIAMQPPRRADRLASRTKCRTPDRRSICLRSRKAVREADDGTPAQY